MKAFFRRLEVQTSQREVMVKESLTSQLMSSIKEVQVEHAHLANKDEELKNAECTNSLCSILEAIFIHGLKETLADRVSLAIANPDQRPEPDFWSPLMVFSHRNVIKQVLRMSQITTDIGRCRAWVRLALNDGLLLSYIDMIIQQNNALNPYYKKSAYLRDVEALNVAKNLLEGLSSIMFALPTNSSILNMWTNTPLLLAGLWTAPMKSCPVFTGTDVAKTLSIGEIKGMGDGDTDSLLSMASHQESLSGFGRFSMNEDEALKLILGTPVEGSPLQSVSNVEQENAEPQSETELEPNLVKENVENTTQGFHVDDSLIGEGNQASEVKKVEKEIDKEAKLVVSKSQQQSPNLSVQGGEKKNVASQSYHSLLKDYTPSSNIFLNTPDLKDILQRYESFPTKTQSPDTSGSDDGVSKLGYEVVNETPLNVKTQEFRNLIEHLSKIMQEPGLESQNFTCTDCGQPIGISFTKARLCYLSGWYFCSDCFTSEEWVIPARILHNWDFSRFEVSGKAATFLNEIQFHPLLDVRKINPKLYLAVEEMSSIQKLRLRLNLLRGYLQTCREPVIKKLQKQVWPREYLYEHVHLYSVADLVEIPKGDLAQFLEKMIKFSEEHVLTCCLCSQKGFFCEICKDVKVIYPFDLDTSYRCLLCKGVFHTNCRNKVDCCPKCERIKKRRADLEREDSEIVE